MSTALRKPQSGIYEPAHASGAVVVGGVHPINDFEGLQVWGGSVTEPHRGAVTYLTTLTAPTVTVPDYTGIHLAIQGIKKELAAQRSMIEQILAHVSVSEPGLIIEMEEVDNTVAKERILKLFHDHAGTLFYDEIAEKLHLPLRQIVEICNLLEQEGLIGEPATK